MAGHNSHLWPSNFSMMMAMIVIMMMVVMMVSLASLTLGTDSLGAQPPSVRPLARPMMTGAGSLETSSWVVSSRSWPDVAFMLMECWDRGRDTGGTTGELWSLMVLRRALDLSTPPSVSAGTVELLSSLGGEPGSGPCDLSRLLLMAKMEERGGCRWKLNFIFYL